MYSTTDFKNGLKIELDGKPYEIIQHQHHKPGKGGAVMRTKLRQLMTGQVIDKTFRSGEKVKKPDMSHQDMQFLYKDGEDFVFMNLEDYDQLHVPTDAVGDKGGYIKEGDTVKVLLYNGQLIGVDLPASVILEVAETDPGIQATAYRVPRSPQFWKPAKTCWSRSSSTWATRSRSTPVPMTILVGSNRRTCDHA